MFLETFIPYLAAAIPAFLLGLYIGRDSKSKVGTPSMSNNSAIVSALQFLRESVPSAMESYPQALSLISQLEERLNNIVTSQ